MKYTDLLLLDLKEINPERHKNITGFDNANILDMAQYLSEIGKPVWIRHVLVPDLSDFDEDLDKLNEFIKTLKNVENGGGSALPHPWQIQVGEPRDKVHA